MLLLLAFVQRAAAQQSDSLSSPQSLERKRMESLWFSATDNAAGAQLDQMGRFGSLGINYNHSEGDFQPTQRGRNNDGYGFSTDGGGEFDNLKGAFLWGYFDYSHDKIREARYNASLIDPLRGTPFYLADRNVSDWIHQNYQLGLKAATPVMGRHWVLGIGVDYQNAQGAKQIDPRPNVQLSKFAITPSVAFTAGRHTVGANYSYRSRREDGTAQNSISLITQPVWEVVAPGFYNTAEVGSGSFSGLRAYNANAMGGGVQYGYATDRLRLLLAAEYDFEVEDVNNHYTTPKTIGTTRQSEWAAKARLNYDFGRRSALLVEADYLNRSIDGIEYVQVYDSSHEVAQWIVISKNVRSNFSTERLRLKADYMLKRGNSYSWLVGFDVERETLSDIYYLPRSTQKVESVVASARVKKNFSFGRNSILVGARYALKENLDNEHTYAGNYADSEIYKNMVLRDFDYLRRDASALDFELGYSRGGVFKSLSSLFLNLEGRYLSPRGEGAFDFDDHLQLMLKTGLTF